MTKSKLYKITSWRDNAIKIVLTQGEGASIDNPAYNKKIQFQLCEPRDQLLTVPNSAEIVLAIERPDHSTDLISGSLVENSESEIEFNIKNTITSIAGLVKGEIRIITAQSVIKFYGINFNIYGSINNNGAIESEQFDELIQALQKVINVTGDGEVATMDDVIEHGGINPVASGIIYDYLTDNYYTKTQSDNKFQTLANQTQTIDSTTTTDATKYPSVAAVKDFLHANFYTDEDIDNLLDNIYTKSESDEAFALKSNVYTKSEINAIQTENEKRFALHMSVGFDDNDIPVKFVNKTTLSAGDFIGNNIITAFIGSNVQEIQGGAFTNCNNLSDLYIDKKQSDITIANNSIPNGVTVHYMDGFNYGELIIAAVKYLNSIKANAADVYTKSEVDTAISEIKPYEYTCTLESNQWQNKKQSITIPSQSYVIGSDTRLKLEIANVDLVSSSWNVESITAETKSNNQIEFEYVGDDAPTININVIIELREVISDEAVSQ